MGALAKKRSWKYTVHIHVNISQEICHRVVSRTANFSAVNIRAMQLATVSNARHISVEFGIVNSRRATPLLLESSTSPRATLDEMLG